MTSDCLVAREVLIEETQEQLDDDQPRDAGEH